MKIDVKIKKMERVPWESIQDLQPMDFKNDYHSEKIKQSILKHNYASPIHVWDDNGQLYAVDGHLRMDLLKELKSEGADIPDKLPVVFLDLPDRETAVKYLLEVFNTKSNPINQDSLNQWMEELDVTLEELDVSMDDLHVEIDQEVEYLEEETVGDDDVPDVDNTKTITVKGDLYELGNHRLLCGDSTMIDDVEKLMNGGKADMVFTDPPYNTGMTSESQSSKNGGTLWKGRSSSGKARLSHMFNDSFTDNEWQEFMSAFCNNYYMSMKDNSVAYICLDWRRNHELIPHIKTHFKLSNIIIWDKVVHGLGSDYKYTYEIINVCKKGNPDIDSHQGEEAEYSDVWHIQRKMGRDKDHATKKPIELCERPIRHASKKGDLVLDLFLGSGSTLIACEKTNRKCYGMELDEKYCDVVVRRWVDFMIENGKKDKIVLKRNGQGIDYRDFIDYE